MMHAIGWAARIARGEASRAWAQIVGGLRRDLRDAVGDLRMLTGRRR